MTFCSDVTETEKEYPMQQICYVGQIQYKNTELWSHTATNVHWKLFSSSHSQFPKNHT